MRLWISRCGVGSRSGIGIKRKIENRLLSWWLLSARCVCWLFERRHVGVRHFFFFLISFFCFEKKNINQKLRKDVVVFIEDADVSEILDSLSVRKRQKKQKQKKRKNRFL